MRKLAALWIPVVLLRGCYRELEDITIKRAPADSIPLSLSVPLSGKVAAALNGVAQQDDLVADVEVNGEIVAEGVRGGIRGGLRGSEQSGIRGGIRGAEASGVRGGVRGAALRTVPVASGFTPDDPDDSSPDVKSGATEDELRVSGKTSVRGEPVEPRLQTGDQPPASNDQIAFAFEVTFFMPRKSARDGENSVRTRVRPGKHQDVPLVEVKTTIKIRVSDQQSAVSHQLSAVSGKIYAIGGNGGGLPATNEAYTPPIP